MTILLQQSVSQDHLKMRWQEPYVSAAINNRNFRAMPRGFYGGFEISPGPNPYEVTVNTATPTGITGYLGGAFDAAQAMGWSVAVHESLEGFSCTVLQQRGVNSEFVFDLTLYQGSVVYLALDVQYTIAYPTTGQIKVVDAAELDANPSLLCMGKIEVPSGVAIAPANIILNDPLYPRVLPWATAQKDGFMHRSQAELLELLAVPGASPAFEVEAIANSNGPQTIAIPGGNTYVVGGNDLFIFRNGLKLRRGRDYTEIDRGDGKGDEVEFTGPIRLGDRIVFRGQEYAVSLTNTLVVKDEFAVVMENVTALNFRGTGVLAVPGAGNQVDIIIPAGSGGTNSAVKQKFNDTGTDIPSGRVVTLLADGTVAPCDPKISTHKPYGITNGPIVSGQFGYVVISGFAVDALAGVGGWASGQDAYVSHNGDGTMTAVPPDPLVGSVFRVGIADCADGVASGTPTDIAIQFQRL